MVGVGVISALEAANRGITGVMLRSAGILWDLRKVQPYEKYSALRFTAGVGLFGDCFDRYLIRL